MRGPDPFKWPTELREAAFKGMGGYMDLDDSAAFPTARAAMVPLGREITKQFLESREPIMEFYGKHLFGTTGEKVTEETLKERKEKGEPTLEFYKTQIVGNTGETVTNATLKKRRANMKVITNAYDMDAQENMWEKKFGNPGKRTIKNVRVKCKGKDFSLEKLLI